MTGVGAGAAMELLTQWGPLAASGVAALAALAALGAALAAGAAARRGRAETQGALSETLAEIAAQVQLALAAGRGDSPAEALAAIRDEMATLSTHLSSVTVGQLELNKVVGRAVQSATGDLESRLIDALGDGAVAQVERLEALDESVAAVSTRVEETMANVLTFLAEGMGGQGGGDGSAAALAVDGLRDSLVAQEARLEALREALAAAEARLTAALAAAAPAPSIFDSARVVSVVAAPQAVASAVAEPQAAGPDAAEPALAAPGVAAE